MKRIFRKTIGITLVIAMVLTCVSAYVPKKCVKEAAVDPITDLKLQDYSEFTGKYLIYFTKPAASEGFRVYLDNRTKPLKTITGSGSYITTDDLGVLAVGTHYLRVTNLLTVNGVLQESAKTSVSFEPSIQTGINTEIPQVYIKSGSIGYDYREKNDVTVTVADQDGGSKGLACIDDDGAQKDKAKISSYADIVDAACNIKVRGNTTSTQPKRAWNIKFSGKTSVLGIPKGKKWCLLANSMDKSLMRDMLSYNFGLQNGVKYTSQSRYVDVYLNGDYMGNYQLCEPVEAKSNRVEIDAYDKDSDDILLEVGTRNEEGVDHFTTDGYRQTFDVNDPEKGDDLSDEEVDAKIARAKSFLNSFENVLKYNNRDIEAIGHYIDIDSFVDYYIANELFKNVDFNFSSTRFYIKGDRIYAGPMWDLDLSSGNCKSSYYHSYYPNGDSATGFYCRGLKWYDRLFSNTDFQDKVKQRYYDLQYRIQSLYRDGCHAAGR